MAHIAPKEAIKPISWLIGKWCSIKAHGEYPKIKSFDYFEEMDFNFFGQPLLSYNSKTYLKDEKCTPKHYESGFLKILPSTNKVSFLLAHNFGLTSVEEGQVDGCELKLKSTNIARMSHPARAAVCEIQRNYKLCGDELHMILYMATSEKPLTKHLTVVYKKKE